MSHGLPRQEHGPSPTPLVKSAPLALAPTLTMSSPTTQRTLRRAASCNRRSRHVSSARRRMPRQCQAPPRQKNSPLPSCFWLHLLSPSPWHSLQTTLMTVFAAKNDASRRRRRGIKHLSSYTIVQRQYRAEMWWRGSEVVWRKYPCSRQMKEIIPWVPSRKNTIHCSQTTIKTAHTAKPIAHSMPICAWMGSTSGRTTTLKHLHLHSATRYCSPLHRPMPSMQP